MSKYQFHEIIEFISDKINIHEIDIEQYISTDNMFSNLGGISLASERPTGNRCNSFQKGDILFSNIRTYFKKVWQAEFSGGCSADVLVMRSKNENILLTDYLYLLICDDDFINFTIASSNGAKMPRGDKKAMLKYEFNIPDLEVQKGAVEIYKNFSQKIQLNTQINQTLEQIAQAIFKSWFIDFDPIKAKAQVLANGGAQEQAVQAAMDVIANGAGASTDTHQLRQIAEAMPSEIGADGVPVGWCYCYLKDICNIVYGKNLPMKKLTKNGYPVFGGNGIIGYYSEYLYKKPQVLISCRGAASGKVIYSAPYSFVTNNSLVVECESSNLSSYYIYEYLLNKNLMELVSGSAQPQITIANMSPVHILVPDANIHSFYKELVMSLYQKRYQNSCENKKLSKLRDTLLPKLLNGEIEIDYD